MDFMSEIRIAIPDLDLNNALRLDANLRNDENGPIDDLEYFDTLFAGTRIS